MTQELERAEYVGFLNPATGELLPISVDNAAVVLNAIRAQKARLDEYRRDVDAYLVEQSEHLGTKTLHGEKETVTVSGGPGIDYDAHALMEALEAVGCPESRIAAAVVQEVSYKVDRRVLKQLAGANPAYARAIRSAELDVEKPYRTSVSLRRQTDG